MACRLTIADLKRYTGVINEQLDLPISDEDLREIAKEVSDFDSIAVKLGLKDGDIAHAKANPFMEYIQRTMIIFTTWKKRNGRHATYRWLVDVLLVLQQGQLADETCKLCAKKPVRAAQFESSQHSSMATVEYRTMVRCTSVLVNTMADNVEAIGRAFHEEGVIAPAVFEATQSHLREPKEKAQTLVSALTNKAKITRSAKSNFFKIVAILMSQGTWINELIETLRDKYEELGGHNFPETQHNQVTPDTPDHPGTPRVPDSPVHHPAPSPVDTSSGSRNLAPTQPQPKMLFCGEIPSLKVSVSGGSNSSDGIPYAFGSVRTSQLWDTASFRDPLKVHFINPGVLEDESWMCGKNLLTTNTVLAWATFWNGPSKHYPKIADIHATSKEAQIRVFFTSSEHSRSYVGNDANNLQVKRNLKQPTMWLNLFKKSEADQRSLVLHEFGHALGLDHEHQRSDFWRELEKFTIGEAEMRSGDDGQCALAHDEHFKKVHTKDRKEAESKYDSNSIMHYWFDVKWLQPQYRDREYVEYMTADVLTDKEREVILGVHDRSYKNGELAKDPSDKDFRVLNKAYQPKGQPRPRSQRNPTPTDVSGPPQKPETFNLKQNFEVVKNLVRYKGVILFVVVLVFAVVYYFFFR